MSYGILLLRIILGSIISAHGAQKLFGWFGGGGPRGTAGGFEQLRFRVPLLMASGLLTPLAALAIAVVMLNAIGTVHWRNGFWNTAGGYEFNLLVLTAAVA